MSWTCTIIICLWAIYAVVAVIYMRKVWNEKIVYLRKIDIKQSIKLPASARYDIPILTPWRVYLGVAFLVPLRLLASVPFLILPFILIWPVKFLCNVKVKNNQEPKGKLYVLWQVAILKLFVPPLLWCLGITKLNHKKLRINDVFANYKPTEAANGPAPIVVCNHTSWLDMFFFLMFNVSFLSKSAISTIPFIGTFAVARQCVFLDRECSENRNLVLEKIKTRANRVKSHNDISPLLIFPEGTVTNGRTLMSFKKGAFATGDRIKIYVLKYNTGPLEYVWSIGNVNSLYSMFFGMSQLFNTIDLIEYEDDFDPRWVYASKKIKAEDENAWEEVAKKVKELMAFAGGLHCDETTHRSLVELEMGWEDLNSKLLAQPSKVSK